MSGKSAKRKGSRVEREIVAMLNNDGIDARKQPLSGALDGWKGDIVIEIEQVDIDAREISYIPLVCEVKARANGAGFATLEKWLGANDLLFLKRDRTEPMVAMNYGTFRFLLRK